MNDEQTFLSRIGDYKIIEEIGRGGYAIVYRAEDTSLKKIVALKLLNPILFSDKRMIQAFIQEARIVSGLNHPHIVRILDLDEENGRLFMVMEFLSGGSLVQAIQKHGQPSMRLTASIINDIAEALDFAHSKGFVHGDVKPGNILLTKDILNDKTSFKLSDFGILRAVETTSIHTTEVVTGTPYYISPEQAQSKPLTAQSDQYSLAIVAYELLSGRLPFDGSTPLEIYLKHLQNEVPSLLKINPKITPDIQEIVLRALDKDPENRFPTCCDFSAALRKTIADTESKRFESLISQIKSALQEHDLLSAKLFLEEASQIMPENTEIQEQLHELQVQEQASATYQEAVAQYKLAKEKAIELHSVSPEYQDSRGIINKLVPGLKNTIYYFIQKWKVALLAIIMMIGLGVFVSLVWILFAYSQSGHAYQSTMVAFKYGTPTPTPTNTPTLTPSPTSTSTATPTPTLTLTPTITPTPGFGSTRVSLIDGMNMVYVPSGFFFMGASAGQGYSDCYNDLKYNCVWDWFTDEEPEHEVFLDSYWIDQTEITNAMYEKCVSGGGCERPSEQSSATREMYYGIFEFDDYPVIYVNKQQASDYCQWAGRRLPTEAEWEKAARGTNGRIYPWGINIGITWANYNKEIGDTNMVAAYPDGASPYGALDMAGNVWEWVEDYYYENYYKNSPERNPTGPSRGSLGVLRGGAWNSHSNDIRSANRYGESIEYSSYSIGFRCALSESQSP